MSTMSEEEKKRIRETPMQELLASGEWVKLYDVINPSLKLYDMSPRCRFLQGDWYEGEEIQIFCTHSEVTKTHICPFGDEVECDLNVHLKNLQNQDVHSSKESVKNDL